jgi:type IV pilus assembly protein PilP
MRRTSTLTLGLVLAGATAFAAEPVSPVAQPPAVQTAKAVEPLEDVPYDATGRRDPFRPPHAATNVRTGEALTPLQRYDLGQLKLVAIIYNTSQPRAVVEDEAGLGYIVHAGTPIGPNDGVVRAIERGRVVIQEDAIDYYGEHHPNEVVMDLRTAERGKQ